MAYPWMHYEAPIPYPLPLQSRLFYLGSVQRDPFDTIGVHLSHMWSAWEIFGETHPAEDYQAALVVIRSLPD